MSADTLIIGRNSVTEALKAGRSITKIYVASGNETKPLQRIRDLAAQADILVEETPLKVLNRLAPDNRHQGVVAFAKAVEYADLTDVLIAADEKGKVPFLVLLDGLEDVHNVGAIIRTAECAGADAVLLPKRRSAPINETVARRRPGLSNTCTGADREHFPDAETTQKTGVLGYRRRYGGGNRLLPQLFDRSRRPGHRK